METQVATVENAINLISSMPKSANWDDIMYEIYVKQKIEKGLQDCKNRNVTSHEDVKKYPQINGI